MKASGIRFNHWRTVNLQNHVSSQDLIEDVHKDSNTEPLQVGGCILHQMSSSCKGKSQSYLGIQGPSSLHRSPSHAPGRQESPGFQRQSLDARYHRLRASERGSQSPRPMSAENGPRVKQNLLLLRRAPCRRAILGFPQQTAGDRVRQ